ncbi:retinol dehydrogenase 13 isoform X2 [Delphinapterus leucas]|uniref:Retinol dehydrogenase 13 isoform X2 n=1 Tax=Delphinapterus leucas TaxID=9749 RepID=A0A7F8KAK9_DELLE|nr:retinol dehydrogenase 13 isoform X2 [Delphinapterus leucas]
MNRYILPLSVLGTAVGGAVLLKDFVAGGACPSKTTIPGKTVIVTGANTGIGKQTALELARRGGAIILACRDLEKCEAAAKEIRGETLNHHVNARHLDLASLKSIREFAAKIIEEEERVHILINNAAVMRCPHWTTEDGFEMQLGVNYLGHFLLTNLLLDKLKASAPSRIINLSSLAHVAGHIDFEDLNWEKRKYDTKAAYCQSKLAVVLFTKELSRRLQGTGVTVNALHPGVARTELGRHTGMHSSTFSSFTLDPGKVLGMPSRNRPTQIWPCYLRVTLGTAWWGGTTEETGCLGSRPSLPSLLANCHAVGGPWRDPKWASLG